MTQNAQDRSDIQVRGWHEMRLNTVWDFWFAVCHWSWTGWSTVRLLLHFQWLSTWRLLIRIVWRFAATPKRDPKFRDLGSVWASCKR